MADSRRGLLSADRSGGRRWTTVPNGTETLTDAGQASRQAGRQAGWPLPLGRLNALLFGPEARLFVSGDDTVGKGPLRTRVHARNTKPTNP